MAAIESAARVAPKRYAFGQNNRPPNPAPQLSQSSHYWTACPVDGSAPGGYSQSNPGEKDLDAVR
jgi:hypothetical protein